MSVPRRANGSDPKFKTDESLVAESVFYPGQKLEEIILFLRREKVSGILTVNLANGGATRISVRQSQPVTVES